MGGNSLELGTSRAQECPWLLLAVTTSRVHVYKSDPDCSLCIRTASTPTSRSVSWSLSWLLTGFDPWGARHQLGCL